MVERNNNDTLASSYLYSKKFYSTIVLYNPTTNFFLTILGFRVVKISIILYCNAIILYCYTKRHEVNLKLAGASKMQSWLISLSWYKWRANMKYELWISLIFVELFISRKHCNISLVIIFIVSDYNRSFLEGHFHISCILGLSWI